VTVSESQFTRPHRDCPRPDLWTAADAYSTELEVTELVAAFVRALQPEYVVETGTCWGQTAEAIGRALQANGHGRAVSLEVNAKKVEHSTLRCVGLPVLVTMCSSMAFTPEEPIGFAWFDSLIPLRVQEFERDRPWLIKGSIVGFHDTSPHMGYGHEIEKLGGLRPIRLRTPRGVTFAEVL
jgi:hypothetical protein